MLCSRTPPTESILRKGRNGRSRGSSLGGIRRRARGHGAGSILSQHAGMLRRLRVTAALCALAASGALCALVPTAVMAKHKPSVVAKHTKHKSSAARHASSKRRSSATKDKSADAAERKTVTLTPRTPVDKYDCIAQSQTFYERAQTVFRAKQGIPQEFERVASNLDEFCGEEEFEKARVSFDWMSACLQNYTKDKLGVCSRDKSYFCALDPHTDGCGSD